MSSDKKDPPPKATDFGGLYLPGDRLPTPMVVERNSDSAWALFNELQVRQDVPPEPGGTDQRHAATEPARLASRQAGPTPAIRRAVMAQDAMLVACHNNRVCPLPLQWKALYELLPVATGANGKREPTPPINTAAAWRATPPLSKRMILREQVEWAANNGCLEPVHAFLVGMQEDEWHHMGDG